MSANQRHGNCPTSGKRMYESRAEAKHNLRQSRLKLSVYRCDGCGWFHQGGWHGVVDRAAHRGETTVETYSITNAAHCLSVSHDFITRLVTSGKVRSIDGQPYRADIDRLAKLT
mgnify:CR=1 FL=1